MIKNKSRLVRLVRMLRCVTAFVLAVAAIDALPGNPCGRSSSPVLISILLICVVSLPCLAFRASRASAGWIIAFATPFVTLGAMLFYINAVDSDWFPPGLITHEFPGYDACLANRKQMEGAKATWALEGHKSDNDTPTDSDLFGADLYMRDKPVCSEGGMYALGRVQEPVRCSLKQHAK
jgi:hypothetical protein